MKALELPPSWPDPAPTEILPGLWQGGTSESSLIGRPSKPDHYRGKRPFDLIVTLYADAQPAPWGVEEIRYGFPGAELNPRDLDRVREIAAYAAEELSNGLTGDDARVRHVLRQVRDIVCAANDSGGRYPDLVPESGAESSAGVHVVTHPCRGLQ